MADDMDEVTQRFTAEVEDYVAEVQEAAEEAKRFADANTEAKLAADGLRDGSAEAALSADELRDRLVEVAGAAGLYRDELGKLRDSEGKFFAESALMDLALSGTRDEALEAAAAMHELRDSEAEAGAAAAASSASMEMGALPLMAIGIVALIGLLAAVAPAVVAAVGAFGAFTVFAYPAVKQVTGALGDTKAQLDRLPGPVRTVVEEVKNLEGQWKSLSAQFALPVDNLMSQGLGIVSDLLPKLIPLAQAGAKAAGQLMDALGKGLDSKGFSDLLTMMEQLSGPATSALIGLAGALGGVLLDALEQLEPYAVPMIKMLQQLVAAAGPALTGALVFLAQAVMDIGEAITPVLGPLGKFFGYLDDHPVFAQIAAGILGVVVAIKIFQGVMSVVSLLSDPWVLLAVAIAVVALLIITHTHQIAVAFDDVRHHVAEAGHDIATWFDRIRHDIAQWAGDVRHDAASIGDAIARPFEQAYDWIAGHWKDILVWLTDPVGAAVFEIRTHTHEIAAAFDKMRHEAASTLAGWRHDIATDVDDVMVDIDHFTTWLPHEIAHGFDTARHDAAAAIDGARHDIAHVFDEIRHDVATWVDDVLRFFKRLPGQVTGALAALPGDLYKAGVNALTGLMNGIGSMVSTVKSHVSGWGHDIANAVVNPFGIHFSEPSEAAQMIRAGVNATRGLAAGMLSEVGSVRQAASAISAAAGLGGHGALGAAVLGAGTGASGYGGSGQVHVTVPLTAIFGAGSGSLATDPRFMQFIQQAVQEAVARWGLNNPGTGFGLPGRA